MRAGLSCPCMVRTQITRIPELASTERSDLDALLDAALVGHFALQADGHPVVVPTAIARDGDSVLAHGSTGSRWMRALAGERRQRWGSPCWTASWWPGPPSSPRCTTAVRCCSDAASRSPIRLRSELLWI